MRIKVAVRNLLISQAIIFIFLFFAYIVWFPYAFSQLGGFYKTAVMLIFADLILGPLLVFIVFKEGKKYLTFDMNVLLSIQIAAFMFGAYSLFLKHPAYAVFKGDRFILTNVSHLYPQQHWLKQIKASFFSSPELVVTRHPDNPKELMQLALDVDVFGKPDIEMRPDLFKPLKQNLDEVFSKSIPAGMILTNKVGQEKLNKFLSEKGGNVDDYAFFPLSGNNKREVIWVLHRSTAEPAGIIDYSPILKLALSR